MTQGDRQGIGHVGRLGEARDIGATRVSAAARQDAIPTSRLSTDDLPERDRLAAWREFYGRKFLRLEHEPLCEDAFRLVLALRQLPGLGLVSVDFSPLRVGRTRDLIADGNDGVTASASTDPR